MRDKTNGNIYNIIFIYGKNSKYIKGNLKLIKKNSRNISEVGIIDFDNMFWFKPKTIYDNNDGKY